jgi:hypothetical protein
MSSGEVGGQKLSPALYYIFGANGICKENFDFFLPKNYIFPNNFRTSQDIHKSAINCSTPP